MEPAIGIVKKIHNSKIIVKRSTPQQNKRLAPAKDPQQLLTHAGRLHPAGNLRWGGLYKVLSSRRPSPVRNGDPVDRIVAGFEPRSRIGYNSVEVLNMRQVSLREFRMRGEKALGKVPKGEVVLLSGQKGPVYYLVPVQGDIAVADKELRRAMAVASLRESWRYAQQQGFDQISDEEIDEEIRKVRLKTKRKAPR
jgi:antitoxin (DNA-binding transcriptional repressor) of toxin-antitoxin stability system